MCSNPFIIWLYDCSALYLFYDSRQISTVIITDN